MKNKAAFWRGFWEGMNPLCWLAWLLYGAGHVAYLLSDRWHVPGMHGPYHWLMLRSYGMCRRFRLVGPWGNIA